MLKIINFYMVTTMPKKQFSVIKSFTKILKYNATIKNKVFEEHLILWKMYIIRYSMTERKRP